MLYIFSYSNKLFKNMNTKKRLSVFIIILISSLSTKAQYSKDNVETNLNSFSTINGQWRSVTPANNTLGTTFYQGLNFGYDANNYVSITNPISTNELYFGRWVILGKAGTVFGIQEI